jgi:3-keto-L-gulonate-6-phosphate decarboxylase
MDGGYLEAEMMAKAGADFVVVMGRAHEATLRRVIQAGAISRSASWGTTSAPTIASSARGGWRRSAST